VVLHGEPFAVMKRGLSFYRFPGLHAGSPDYRTNKIANLEVNLKHFWCKSLGTRRTQRTQRKHRGPRRKRMIFMERAKQKQNPKDLGFLCPFSLFFLHT
jgi:hypothetical protein